MSKPYSQSLISQSFFIAEEAVTPIKHIHVVTPVVFRTSTLNPLKHKFLLFIWKLKT